VAVEFDRGSFGLNGGLPSAIPSEVVLRWMAWNGRTGRDGALVVLALLARIGRARGDLPLNDADRGGRARDVTVSNFPSCLGDSGGEGGAA
jgi:hypothetical protein